jgi:hypothetical protein
MIAECGIRIAEYPSPHPSPPRGEGKGEGRFGHFGIGARDFYGICDLEFGI